MGVVALGQVHHALRGDLRACHSISDGVAKRLAFSSAPFSPYKSIVPSVRESFVAPRLGISCRPGEQAWARELEKC